mmetsp:Transcript_18399/g.45781  ORF Transcript_18399/g.45781 Transcript_18399/m.45781 type:complete len:278 (-) Transcript_18399:233-1066(-)
MGGVNCACNDCERNNTETVPPPNEKQYDVANLATVEDLHQPSFKTEPPPEVTSAEKVEEQTPDILAPVVEARRYDEKARKEGVVRFQVKLRKDGAASGGYGFAHAALEGAGVLMVMELRAGGIMAQWNADRTAEGKPEDVIRPGDRIVALEGAEDLSAMRSMFREQESVDFTVERWPDRMKISLKRDSPADSFGMNVDPVVKQDGSKVLVIFEVNPGVIQEWNTRAAGEKEFYSIVTPGCELISLNGNEEPNKMMESLLNELTVEMVLRRPELPMPN